MISPSYFVAEAAVELGFFKAEGLDVSLELVFPVDKAYAALRDGAVDFVGGSAHAALAAFPNFRGVKLICAQAQGMYWFLVMHADTRASAAISHVVKGRSIGAAPWVDMGLRGAVARGGHRLEARQRQHRAGAGCRAHAGRDREFRRRCGEGARRAARSTASGPTAWAPRSRCARGVGSIVLDVRRGDGPKPCFNYTAATIAATDALIARAPDVAAAAVRAIVKTQAALKADVARAAEVGQQIISPTRGRADRRPDPPRPALLRRHAVARFRRRHDAIRARARHPRRRRRPTSTWSRRNSRRCGSAKRARTRRREIEALGHVVGLLGDRIGVIDPDRAEQRIPDQAGADRGADGASNWRSAATATARPGSKRSTRRWPTGCRRRRTAPLSTARPAARTAPALAAPPRWSNRHCRRGYPWWCRA